MCGSSAVPKTRNQFNTLGKHPSFPFGYYSNPVAYRQPDGTDVIHGTPLEEPYFAKALPVVKEQLKKAGVRLALLMNAAADGTLPPNLLQLSE